MDTTHTTTGAENMNTIIAIETTENSDLETIEQFRIYRIDMDALTVYTATAPIWGHALAQHGEWSDLNADGEPCSDIDDLRAFIREMYLGGAFDAAARDEMLEACG